MARGASPRSYWYVLACVAMVAPGVLWAALDRRPWPWDQAQYGEYTLRTLEAFRDGPLAGLAAMGVLMGIKAPGLTWLGMPFAMFAEAGRPETALLCATLACQIGTLLAVYYSALRVARCRVVALGVTAFVGSTPLSIALQQHYLVEPLQTFSVALAYLLALSAARLSKVALFSALCGVAALAMAAKSTSPLHCGLPLLFAATVLVTRPAPPASPWVSRLGVPLVLAALMGVALVGNWYVTNFGPMLENARQATAGSVALLYGTQENFALKLWHWISAFAAALFVPHILVLLAGVLTAGGALVWRRRIEDSDAPPDASTHWVIGSAVVSLAAGFAVYSLQTNDDVRFLQPFLPAAAIVVAWLCQRRWRLAAGAALLSVALVQFVLLYGQAFGLSPKATDHPYLQRVEQDDAKRNQLLEIVAVTCDRDRLYDLNLVGVQYPWLSASSATFYAVVRHGARPVCRFAALENPAEKPSSALRKLDGLPHRYFITVRPEKMLPPDFINFAAAEAFARVSQSPHWDYFGQVNDTVVIFRSKRY